MYKLQRIFLTLLALLALAVPALAYDGKTEDIVVHGTASQEYHPDTAYVDFTIVGIAKSPDEAANKANLKAQALEASRQAEVKALGKLESNHYSLHPIYNDKGKIINYQANKFIKYSVADPAKAGYFIDLLLAAGVDQVNKIDFVVQDHKELSRQLLKEAVEDARLRAQIAATASNRNLGRLLHMTIYNSPSLDSRRYYAKSMANEAATTLEPTDVRLDVQVEATFALE